MKLASFGGWPGMGVAAAAVAAGVGGFVFRDSLPFLASEPSAPVEQASVPAASAPAPSAPEASADAPAETAQDETADAADASAPEVVVEAPSETAPAETPDAAPDPQPPQFDVVRVEADGTTLVAGKAAPQWPVAVMLDGAEMSRQTAGRDGKFVAFLDLPTSDAPRVMTLVMYGPSGEGEVVSSDQVILAPSPAPVEVASAPESTEPEAADPAAAPEADATASPTEEVAEAAPEAAAPRTEQVAETDAPRTEDIAEAAPQPSADATPSVDAAEAPPVVTAQAEDVEDAPVAQANDVEIAALQPAPEAQDTPDGTRPREVTPEPDVSDSTDSAPVPEAQASETALADTDVPAEDPEAPEADSPVAAVDPAPEPEEPAPDAVAEVQTETPDAPEAQTRPLAQAGTTVLLSNASGVRVLQRGGAGPEVLDNVALDAITYSDEGDVLLAGRGGTGSFVRIYLDDKPVTTLPVAEDGTWRTDLPNVDTGVYRLRVDEVDKEGTVQSRVETPFERVAEAVAADAVARSTVSQVTVQPGNTLWAIARDSYGEGLMYVRVYEANKDLIRDPDLIYPGQIFTVPEGAEPAE